MRGVARSAVLHTILLVLLAACALPAAPVATPPPATAPTATMPSATQRPTVPPATPTLAPRAPTYVKLLPAETTGEVYRRLELIIETDGTFANPFDPAEVDLWVRFSGPGDIVVSVPAFWYQGFERESLRLDGPPGWRVRFIPHIPGQWSAQAELVSPALQSEPIALDVEPASDPRGFVRLDPENPRYFAFENGEPYYAIGPNLGWPTTLRRTTIEYERWLSRLSGNGGSVARLWMASWSFGIEWLDTGLGDYSKRMQQAWALDQVFEIAEQHDIYIILSLLNHGAFSETVNPEWTANPYNAANRGPLASPELFVSDPQAREFFKRRLRYIAARWGASTHLLAWEWWNEVNLTPISDLKLRPWIKEMSAAIREYDPYNHLISNSYAGGSTNSTWTLPEIGIAQQHDYTGADPALLFPATYRAFTRIAPDKPALVAEHGYSAASAYGQAERVHFHNGIWTAPFTGFAGTSMAWWWESFIDPNQLWREYRPLADFLEGERLAALTPGTAGLGSQAYAFTLQSETHALIWVRNKAYEGSAAGRAYAAIKAPPSDWVYRPEVISGATLTITGLEDGAYTARWFDSQSGTWLEETPLQVTDQTATLLVPDFDRDLAVKILRN